MSADPSHARLLGSPHSCTTVSPPAQLLHFFAAIISMNWAIHDWVTADSAPCAFPRGSHALTSCNPLRVSDLTACAAACSAVANCTHASGVVRASTWCYLRTGDRVWASATRCAARLALRSVLKPIVVIIRGRSELRWPNLNEREWADRNNCSAHKSEVQLRAQRRLPYAADSIDADFARFCGPSGALDAWPSEEVKARLGRLHEAGVTQHRLGSASNIARSRLQMRCVYHLTRRAARLSLLAQHSSHLHGRASVRARRELLGCETGFNGGHAAIILLSALEAEAKAQEAKAQEAGAEDAKAKSPAEAGSRNSHAAHASYLGLDLGLAEWSHSAARLLNTSLSNGWGKGRVNVFFGEPKATAPMALQQQQQSDGGARGRA